MTGVWQEWLHPRDQRGRFSRSRLWAQRLSDIVGQPWERSGYTHATYRRNIDGTLTKLTDEQAHRIKYYHATVVPRMRKVLPADTHGGPVTFASDTDRRYAYVTTSLKDAWSYAEDAWNAASMRGSGPPRVYRVEATGPVEIDPQVDARGNRRGNKLADARSRHPFQVLQEMPMPKSMGKPKDWR